MKEPTEEYTPEQAQKCLEDFFFDQKMYCGGKIPKNLLLSNTSYLKLDLSECIDRAYSLISQDPEYLFKESGENIEPEIEHVIKILDKCSAKRVPKQFAGGVMLIYLSLCEGFGFE